MTISILVLFASFSSMWKLSSMLAVQLFAWQLNSPFLSLLQFSFKKEKKKKKKSSLSDPFKYFFYFFCVVQSKSNAVFHQFWCYGFPPSDTILSEL